MATTAQVTTIPGKAATGRRAAPARTPSDSRAWAGEDRYRMIAEAAYFKAEQRGFLPGNELEDWLAAEIEVDDLLGDAGPR